MERLRTTDDGLTDRGVGAPLFDRLLLVLLACVLLADVAGLLLAML